MTDRLIATFATVLNIPAERLNDDSSPANTPEWDSLATVNLTLAVERAFSVRLGMREVRKMSTIGLARDVLRGKGVSDI
jgi:acyl carrier protein